jgi:hypothetical protein
MHIREEFSWQQIAKSLKTTRRSETQVRKKWGESLRPRVMQRLRKSGTRPWTGEDDWRMIQAVLDGNFPDKTVVR